MSTSKFYIVSGTSGSGKTIALQVLEDLGFYCIDNMPASLLPDMAARVLGNRFEQHNCAVSIDSRNQDFIGDLKSSFDNLNSFNIETRVIFLDAEDTTLLKRFSETRRKHPLSDQNTSLVEAIAKERKLLEHISDIADRHINTTRTTPHELRTIIRDDGGISKEHSLTLLFQSFGFKYGNPNDADFVFDVRCLPNPHWHAELKPLTGRDAPVADFLSDQPMCVEMLEQIRNFVEHWLPYFAADNRNYITVAIGCTGGQHRSVYLTERLRDYFSNESAHHAIIQTLARHRELVI